MNKVIRLDDVTKRFGEQFALDRVTLEVPAGSVFALLGENGAGKTTALRILLGLMDPDAGRASILGLDSTREGREIRNRVGYVPEQPDLYDWMTVAEIGWFAAGFHGDAFWPGYQKAIDDFGIPPRKKIKALSKGMRAKVSLALALAHDPDVLILDEPTSGLDAIVRREFLESMVDRAARGKTVFLSSHQINEVERVADFVAIVRKGKLLALEPLEQLKGDTKCVRLALADESTPLPEFPGRVIEHREQGKQLDLLLRGVDESDIVALQSHPVVRDLSIHTPSLEEIFVAYMTSNGRVEKEQLADESADVASSAAE